MTKLEQAARQALGALEMAVSETLDYIQKNHLCGAENNHWIVHSKKAITALREALAEQAEQEPVNVDAINTSSEYVDEIENKRHEPVAWVNKERTQSIEWLKIAPEHGTKLYAAPVRTKDLTDDEIDACDWGQCERDFARAVIAAYKEKNK